jgi:hypothetical protein
VYERLPDKSLALLRARRDPRDIFTEVHRHGGWTQVNHPTIFPPTSPAVAALCRGCFWEYAEAQTDYSKLDAYELATGPSDLGGAPNPFTVSAIADYERLLGLGHRIAAVGSSDSHDAGNATGILDAPIGEATTVVRAPELSEEGIRCGVKDRHTYVKVTGNAGPDIRFTARPWSKPWQEAIVGDALATPAASFHVEVTGAAGSSLLIVKDGATEQTVPITSDAFNYLFHRPAPGRWRLQVMRGSLVDTVSSPIWLEPGRSGLRRSPCRGGR